MSIIRKTKSVRLILSAFNDNKDAISIVELINKFNKKMNKTTVYRVLERLEKSSILHSFVGKDGLKRYAKGGKNSNSKKILNSHPHFLCEDCGTSSCIPIDIIIPSIPNYTIKTSEHLLIGQCKNCLS
ncbi:MAG: transcriptional regulator [Flavobacteriales bacterium]|nr:transcriptional regulator [Flavobacteriales bacterium]|tara:strand:- start:5402 stop:5785 length:384 start_codon:yes stop_codon:yes gene_type:complete